MKSLKKPGATGAFDNNQGISLQHYLREIMVTLLNCEFPGSCTVEKTSGEMLHVFNQLFQPNLMDLVPEHQITADNHQKVHTRTVKDLPKVCIIRSLVPRPLPVFQYVAR